MVTSSPTGSRNLVSQSNAKKLAKIYYNPVHYASFSSVNKLWTATGKKIPKKIVTAWLLTQDTYTRHKPRRVKFRRNCYILNNIDDMWESDLIIMPPEYSEHNDGVKYILIVIDGFSKYLFTTPLQRKTTDAIIDGFKKIFETTERRPLKLRTDKGGEYDSRKFRKFMKDNDITYFTSNNPDTKCSLVERVIKSVKGKLFKYLTHVNSYRYIDVFDKIVQSYNNSYHRTIKMAPNDVNDDNILEVYNNIKESQKVPAKKEKPKLKVGDYIRITKSKGVFSKGYSPNWTGEVFKIKSIVRRKPPVYYIVDLEGEDILGTFYEHELQKVNYNGVYAIDKIIKTRRMGRGVQYLVKWRGFNNTFNSWISSKSVQPI